MDAGEIIKIVFGGCCDASCFCGTKTEAQIDAELNTLADFAGKCVTVYWSILGKQRIAAVTQLPSSTSFDMQIQLQ